MRWGGIALIAAGSLGLVAGALFAVAALRAPEGAFSYASDSFFIAASFLQGLPMSVLICVGLAGLYFLLAGAPKLVGRMSLIGVVLFFLGFVFPLILFLVIGLSSQGAYGTYYGAFPLEMLFTLSSVAQGAGMTLCGIAAFWARGFGRWRFLMLAVGVLDSPLLYSLVFAVVRRSIEPPVVPYADTRWMQTSLQVPVGLVSVGWILVGRLLYGARDRESALVAAKYLALSEENSSKALRLYEETWKTQNPAVVDELVAENLMDHEHDRYGRVGFKKAIADLHRTFPDLDLSIEEQDADGDTVTTRCAFSGTDRGGVLWYPPTGKHATFTGTFTDRFSDGMLVEHRGGLDMRSLLQQLGLTSGDEV